jgi:NCAIR mutase (PurE)-related protein
VSHRIVSTPDHQSTSGGRFAVPDFGRAERKGVPEVILADRKTTDQAVAIAKATGKE